MVFKWFYTFVTLFGIVNAQSYESVVNLRSTLLTSNYNPDMLPLNEQSNVLNINLSASVFTISQVDPVRGAVTMGIMVTQEWYDQRLTWKPSEYSGITNFSVKSEDVWTPPLTVANPVTFTVLNKPWMQVMFFSNGKAVYTVEDIIEFTCSFYMKFWPFDKHVCSLKFFAYGYPYNRMTLSVPGQVVNTDYYTSNGEWHLDKHSFGYRTDKGYGMSQVIYTFRISRLPAFYMLTEIIPINGIGALTCFVFLLPSESGERISFSITIMLSLAVFLTLTADDLPKKSEPVPIMCLYIFFNMTVCICALILVILNLRLYHRDDNIPIPEVYKSLVRLLRCKCFRKHAREGIMSSHMTDTDNLIQQDNSFRKVEKKNESEKKSSQKLKFSAEEELITWKTVSEAIDKFLFYAMVVLTYIPSIIIVVYIAVASDYINK